MSLIVDFWIIVVGLISWFSLKHKDIKLTNNSKAIANARSIVVTEFDDKYMDTYPKVDTAVLRSLDMWLWKIKTYGDSGNEQINKIYIDAQGIIENYPMPPHYCCAGKDIYLHDIMADMIMASQYGKLSMRRCHSGYYYEEWALMDWVRAHFKGAFNSRIVIFRDRSSSNTKKCAWEGSVAAPYMPNDEDVEYR